MSTPHIHIEGLDKVIRLDLEKHKGLLEREKVNLLSYREAVSHQVRKKKHYRSLVGQGEYDDAALEKSIGMINVDIRQLSDKVKLTNEAIEHHTLIVDTLTVQLQDYEENAARH